MQLGMWIKPFGCQERAGCVVLHRFLWRAETVPVVIPWVMLMGLAMIMTMTMVVIMAVIVAVAVVVMMAVTMIMAMTVMLLYHGMFALPQNLDRQITRRHRAAQRIAHLSLL